MQPLGAVREAPFEPAGTLVELAYQDQQFKGGGIDAGGEIDDAAIEFIDGEKALFG